MSEYYLVKGDQRIELIGRTLFGRSDDCDIKLTEGHPSRNHARVTVEDDGVWVEDLESVNGTFINDNQVTERTRLEHGDVVAFDVESYRFEGDVVDDQATVLRSVPVEDEAQTIMRPIDAEPPAPPPAPPPPEAPTPTPAAPPPDVSADDSAAKADVPKSWADPEYQDEQGTVMLSPEQLRAFREGGEAPGQQTEGSNLAVLSGQSADAVLEFEASAQSWSIGTDAEHALVLTDQGVSAFHAQIVREGERWKLIDQMSANGTFINDQKTTVGFLASGDRVRFGPVECVVTLPKSSRQAAPPAAVKKQTAVATKPKSNTWLIAAGVTIATIIVLVVVSRLF
ncbi:MAG: FHA domain-containing protein [Gammaproteobacteria bacterium]|nr:FHA domain-containing protein [Gammaproteobacteria bacterium]